MPRGGARPGAGRKPVPPDLRALREAIVGLDAAVQALGGTDNLALVAMAEMLAALGACLRARLLATRP